MYGNKPEFLFLFVGSILIRLLVRLAKAMFQIVLTLGEILAMGLIFGLPNPKLLGKNLMTR